MHRKNVFSMILIANLISNILCGTWNNSTGTYPCHYHCQQCNGPTQNNCTICQANYIIYNNSCYQCGSHCATCNPTNDFQKIPKSCQTCRTTYYYSQSLLECLLCPYGSKQCTLSQIQQCSKGYYKQSGSCYSCIEYCQQCTNINSCQSCISGYYYFNSQCVPCGNNCAFCDSSACYDCIEGFYGPQCQSQCPPFCAICQGDICYRCKSTYIHLEGLCVAHSVLCSIGNSLSTCAQCLQQYSYLQQNQCILYPQLLDSQSKLLYWSPVINAHPAEACNDSLLFYTPLAQQAAPSVKLHPLYMFDLNIRIAYLSPPSSINLCSTHITECVNIVIPLSSPINCNGNSLYLSNHKIKSIRISPDFNSSMTPLTFTLSPSVSIVQFLIIQYPCIIDHCEQCLSGLICQSCYYPYLLQINQCVKQCQSGYYYNNYTLTCDLTCLKGYYPIREQYICIKCLFPCLICIDELQCTSCQTGYYLFQGKCFNSCGNGYYPQMNVCQSCIYPCKNCLSSTLCLSCNVGYLHQQTCVQQCPSGYYSNFTSVQCEQCQYPCTECQYANTICTKCITSLFLSNSVCISQCLPNSYPKSGICLACPYPCQKCTQSGCISCLVGYHLLEQCLLQCPPTYYKGQNKCLECNQPCLSCISQTRCTSCINGWYYLQYVCVTECPKSYWSNANRNSCIKCPTYCLECVDQNTCNQCRLDYITFQQSCLFTCPNYYYQAPQNDQRICKNCSQNCIRCQSQSICLQCSNFTFLYQGICRIDCPATMYPSINTCQPCISPCAQCYNGQICYSCITNYYLQDELCVSVCKQGTYPLNNECHICPSQCRTCNQTDCLSCTNYQMIINNTVQCTKQCATGYYANQQESKCAQCIQPCLQCHNILNCLQCIQGYFLVESKCLQNCPEGYYFHNLSCISCNQGCIRCFNISNNCTQCQLGYYLQENSTFTQCVAECYGGYYVDQYSQSICLKCNDNCISCVNSQICIQCISTYYKYYSQCLSYCPKHTYQTQGTCQQCINCNECQGSANNCTQCPNNMYLLQAQPFNQCFQQCPNHTYPVHSTILKCESCVMPCLQCISRQYCLSCAAGYLYQYECVDQCPVGYPINHTCQSCPFPCRTCNQTQCFSCLQGYYYNGQCLTKCYIGYYGSNNQCSQCSSICLQCSQYSVCTKCPPNRAYLEDGTCQTSCSQGYYTLQYTCMPCSKFCINCDNGSVCHQCLGAYLYNGSCIQQCPAGYYSGMDNICKRCVNPCAQCISPEICTKCIQGTYLYSYICLSNCPAQYYTDVDNRVCVLQCSTYINQIDRTCHNACPLYHIGRQCVQQCQQQYYIGYDMECTRCVGLCPNPSYKLGYAQAQGYTSLFLIFSQRIRVDQIEQLDIKITYNVRSIYSQQINIYAFRYLEQQNSNQVAHTLLKKQPYLLQLQIQLPSHSYSFNIHTNIKQSSFITQSNVPLQNAQQNLQVSILHTKINQSLYTAIGYFSKIISFLALILIVSNILVDNMPCTIIFLHYIHLFHYQTYYSMWLHPYIEALYYNLSYLPIFSFGKSSLWPCSVKDVYYLGDCSLPTLYVPVVIVFLAAILLIALAKTIYHYLLHIPNKHFLIYNHVFTLWILCNMGFLLPSIRTLTASGPQPLPIIIIFAYILILALLLYQLIKNIYNHTFTQKCFFWKLYKYAHPNPISNIHYLLLIIRQILPNVVNASLTSISIYIYCSVIIIANLIVNHPFKKWNRIICIVQILVCIVLVLTAGFIIAGKEITNNEVYALIVVALALVLFVVIGVVTIIQTLKSYRRAYWKIIGEKDSQSKSSETVKSQSQSEEKAEEKMKSRKKIGSKKQIESKKKIASKKNIGSKRKIESEDSSQFSLYDNSDSTQFGKPAMYLIKMPRVESVDQQKLQ